MDIIRSTRPRRKGTATMPAIPVAVKIGIGLVMMLWGAQAYI